MASPATRTEAALRRTADDPTTVMTVALKPTLVVPVDQMRIEAADLKVVVMLPTDTDPKYPFPMNDTMALVPFKN